MAKSTDEDPFHLQSEAKVLHLMIIHAKIAKNGIERDTEGNNRNDSHIYTVDRIVEVFGSTKYLAIVESSSSAFHFG